MKNETRKKINALLNGKKEQHQTDELIKLFLAVINEQHDETQKSFDNHSKEIVDALSKIDFKPTIEVAPPEVTVNVPEQKTPNVKVNVPKQEKPNVEVNIPDEVDVKEPKWWKQFELPENFFERMGMVFVVALNTLRDRKRPISVNVIDDKGQVIRQFGGVVAPAGGGQERTTKDPISRLNTVATTATKLPKTPASNRKSIILFNNNATKTIFLGGSNVTASGNTIGLPIQPNTFSPPFSLSEQSILFGIVATGTAQAITLEVG